MRDGSSKRQCKESQPMWFEKAKFGSVFRVCVPCVRLGKKCINLLLVSVITNSEKHNSEHLPSSSYQIKTKL